MSWSGCISVPRRSLKPERKNMSLDNIAGAAGSEQATAPQSDTAVHIAGGSGPMSVREAARSVVHWRRKCAAADQMTDDGQERTDAGASEATSDPAQESAQKADTAAAETQPPGETESQVDPAENLPPIEPPRSWTKDEKERFKSLPRETQE